MQGTTSGVGISSRFGRGWRRRTTGWWAVGSAVVFALALVGVAWWALSGSDDLDAGDVGSPDPPPTVTTAVADAADATLPAAPALAVLPRWTPELRGRMGLVHGAEPFEANLEVDGPIALSPDRSHLAFLRAASGPDGPVETVVRRLADGHEEVVEGVTACLRYSADGRLATIGSDRRVEGTRLTVRDPDLDQIATGHTFDTLSCAEWDEGGDRLVAVGRDGDERLVAWTFGLDGSAQGEPAEGLHPDTRVLLGPAVGRGRFLVLVSSQHPPHTIAPDRWEVGELIVGDEGESRYQRIAELAAVPDWSHPDRVLTTPGPPLPLGMARPEVDDDGALVLRRSQSPSFLLVDGISSNLFSLDLDGAVRYLTTGVGSVSAGPAGVGDEHLDVPLVWPGWVERVPSMTPSPCERPSEVEVDLTGDGLPDRAFHEWLGGSDAVLGVCLADGRVDSVAGRGQTEIGGIIELGPDGRSVLIAGGTSVSWGGFDVAVVVDGRIRWVDLDGEVLWLWDGLQLLGDDGLHDREGVYGCEDVTGDGVLELVQVEVDRAEDGTTVVWERRAYRVEDATASLVSTDRGTVAHAELLWDVAAPLTQSCAMID